jgi:hypothetical protein
MERMLQPLENRPRIQGDVSRSGPRRRQDRDRAGWVIFKRRRNFLLEPSVIPHRKICGREIAIVASKVYALEIDRKSQSPFIMFNGQKKHDDEPIKEAQQFIESNITEKISVEDLAYKYAIGRRHFERRFKKATNNTLSNTSSA